MAVLRTVLIVEDNEEIAEAFAMLLEQVSYAVAIARDGREALMLLRTGTVEPDVILLDIALPGMDGFTFRQEQVGDPNLAHIAVIVVSAGGLAQEATAKKLGMPFFRKPVENLDALLEAISKACDATMASRTSHARRG
jgi:CheY-like chemotaxis protein